MILDKGIVIDAYVRFADRHRADHHRRPDRDRERRHLPAFRRGVNRLDLYRDGSAGCPELGEKGAEDKTEGAIEGAKEKLRRRGADGGEGHRCRRRGRRVRPSRRVSSQNRMGEGDGLND